MTSFITEIVIRFGVEFISLPLSMITQHQTAKFKALSFSIRNAAPALFLMSFVRGEGEQRVFSCAHKLSLHKSDDYIYLTYKRYHCQSYHSNPKHEI